MADLSGSTHFRARFESALQDYQQTTGVTLADHPLTAQFRGSHSVEFVTNILRYEARVTSDLRGSDRILQLLQSTVSMLFALSATASFCDAVVLVRNEARMPMLLHP